MNYIKIESFQSFVCDGIILINVGNPDSRSCWKKILLDPSEYLKERKNKALTGCIEILFTGIYHWIHFSMALPISLSSQYKDKSMNNFLKGLRNFKF